MKSVFPKCIFYPKHIFRVRKISHQHLEQNFCICNSILVVELAFITLINCFIFSWIIEFTMRGIEISSTFLDYSSTHHKKFLQLIDLKFCSKFCLNKYVCANVFDQADEVFNWFQTIFLTISTVWKSHESTDN